MRDHFIKMAQNNAWANGVLFAACQALSEDAIWAKRSGFFGSIGRTLNHICEVDLYYVDALEEGGAGRAFYEREDIFDLAVLQDAQADVDERLIRFCKGLSADTLNEMRDTERPDRMTQERVDWLLLHLIQHDIHHRGQVHAMLSEAGVKPPQLDDFYLDDGRVETAKPFWEN